MPASPAVATAHRAAFVPFHRGIAVSPPWEKIAPDVSNHRQANDRTGVLSRPVARHGGRRDWSLPSQTARLTGHAKRPGRVEIFSVPLRKIL